ncbi:MAG: HD-GYP domain-containing protein [Firmicutes bacterium HGW-Firmicutes-1]|nr:MAG: HD-GYP domain-containing protein [Firmicutes bacterium HGW-Firmicutes-1]
MRYVPADGLVEGMVIGKSLYDKNHNLLLSKGSIIQTAYVQRIKNLGYQGVYIDDEISADIEIKDIINDEIRMKMIQTVKDVCIHSNEGPKTKKSSKDTIEKKLDITKQLIATIVEQLLINKDTMVNLIDLKFFDDYTYFHSVNVAVLSVVIGVGLGLDKEELYNLGLGAILHDMGKIFIDKDVVNKPSKLTVAEYEEIKRHSEFGYKYLKETYQIPTASYIGVLHHHEKYDGSGYPSNVSKDSISLIGRIICIADVYDALISNRPYRAALLPSEAMEYIMANGGLMFDVNITKVFARKVAPFPVGTYVKLSNGYTGIVAENFEEACMRPSVKIILDPEGKKIMPRFINLKDDRNLRAVTITAVNNI